MSGCHEGAQLPAHAVRVAVLKAHLPCGAVVPAATRRSGLGATLVWAALGM
jgi:hypothetical protein